MNRDEELKEMKPFRIIADHLARKGIAVLRYDSRGVGGSTGEAFQYALSDVAEDVLAAVRLLKSRDDIEKDKIGLCGHSQGGIVAPMCAASSADVAFMICIAGVGNTGEENFLDQAAQTAEVDGATADEIRDRVKSMRHVIKLVREEAGTDELRAALRRTSPKQTSPGSDEHKEPRRNSQSIGTPDVDGDSSSATATAVDGDTDEDPAIQCQLTLFSSPWFKSFIDHDAQTVLEAVKCPALLIFGGLDRQVRSDTNREAMVAALERGGNADHTARTFATANHLFQSAKTGGSSEYRTLEAKFVPGFLELISDWIVSRVMPGIN